MKKKNKKINTPASLLVVSIIMLIFFQFLSKEVKIEDVSFKERLQNNSRTHTPYEVYFSIMNSRSNSVNCTATLSLTTNKQTNKTKYNIGTIPQRTKLKYKIPFNMPIGNITIHLDKDCTSI